MVAGCGTQLTCKNWQIEAAYRMLQNNLDPQVAFDPDNLIVYGGRGRAARNWAAFDAILDALRHLQPDETLLVQSGKPVAIFTTHTEAPRVLLVNSNIVPKWATQENFDKWERDGLIMYGQMTAGSWIYIGTQGILQGTYETFGALARQQGWETLQGKLVVTRIGSLKHFLRRPAGRARPSIPRRRPAAPRMLVCHPARHPRPPARPAARRSAAQCDLRWCGTGAAAWGRVEPLGWLQREGRGTGGCGRLGGTLRAGLHRALLQQGIDLRARRHHAPALCGLRRRLLRGLPECTKVF